MERSALPRAVQPGQRGSALRRAVASAVAHRRPTAWPPPMRALRPRGASCTRSGFSYRVLTLLQEAGADYEVVNVLDEVGGGRERWAGAAPRGMRCPRRLHKGFGGSSVGRGMGGGPGPSVWERGAGQAAGFSDQLHPIPAEQSALLPTTPATRRCTTPACAMQSRPTLTGPPSRSCLWAVRRLCRCRPPHQACLPPSDWEKLTSLCSQPGPMPAPPRRVCGRR